MYKVNILIEKMKLKNDNSYSIKLKTLGYEESSDSYKNFLYQEIYTIDCLNKEAQKKNKTIEQIFIDLITGNKLSLALDNDYGKGNYKIIKFYQEYLEDK